MRKNKICVVGWHYFSNLYESLRKSSFGVHIISHRYNKMLDDYSLSYSVTENVGLECGAYSYYIDNIWDRKSNIFFMHDDIEILSFNDFMASNSKKIVEKKIEHAFIVPGSIIRGGLQITYMSKNFIKIIKKEYGSIWYDKENLGFTTMRCQPDNWEVRRYNEGAFRFRKMAIDIGKKYNILTCLSIVDNRLTLYNRGENIIKHKFSEKEKKIRSKKINRQKKKRKEQEKLFFKKYKKNNM